MDPLSSYMHGRHKNRNNSTRNSNRQAPSLRPKENKSKDGLGGGVLENSLDGNSTGKMLSTSNASNGRTNTTTSNNINGDDDIKTSKVSDDIKTTTTTITPTTEIDDGQSTTSSNKNETVFDIMSAGIATISSLSSRSSISQQPHNEPFTNSNSSTSSSGNTDTSSSSSYISSEALNSVSSVRTTPGAPSLRPRPKTNPLLSSSSSSSSSKAQSPLSQTLTDNHQSSSVDNNRNSGSSGSSYASLNGLDNNNNNNNNYYTSNRDSLNSSRSSIISSRNSSSSGSYSNNLTSIIASSLSPSDLQNMKPWLLPGERMSVRLWDAAGCHWSQSYIKGAFYMTTYRVRFEPDQGPELDAIINKYPNLLSFFNVPLSTILNIEADKGRRPVRDSWGVGSGLSFTLHCKDARCVKLMLISRDRLVSGVVNSMSPASGHSTTHNTSPVSYGNNTSPSPNSNNNNNNNGNNDNNDNNANSSISSQVTTSNNNNNNSSSSSNVPSFGSASADDASSVSSTSCGDNNNNNSYNSNNTSSSINLQPHSSSDIANAFKAIQTCAYPNNIKLSFAFMNKEGEASSSSGGSSGGEDRDSCGSTADYAGDGGSNSSSSSSSNSGSSSSSNNNNNNADVMLMEFLRFGIIDGNPLWLGDTTTAAATHSSSSSSSSSGDDDPSPFRVTEANIHFKICKTYPRYLVCPKTITDTDMKQISAFRSGERLFGLSWVHPHNKATLWRSSQPKAGISGSNSRDEMFLERLAKSTGRRNGILHIVDCRPKTSALANRATGAGYESRHNYPNCRLEFYNIGNIHAMREACNKVISICTNTNPTVERELDFGSKIEDYGWLHGVRLILKCAWETATLVHKGTPVLVHCSHGWDRTSQVCALAQVLLDPYYRSMSGFCILVEKEWLQYGHPFKLRCAHGEDSKTRDNDQLSPIFLQFLDCCYQLQKAYPFLFEFNEEWLLLISSHIYSCRFGNFVLSSEYDREILKSKSRTADIFTWLTSEKIKLGCINPLYTPSYSMKSAELNQLHFDTMTGTFLPPIATMLRSVSLWHGYFSRYSGVQVDTSVPSWMTQFPCVLSDSNKSKKDGCVEDIEKDTPKPEPPQSEVDQDEATMDRLMEVYNGCFHSLFLQSTVGAGDGDTNRDPNAALGNYTTSNTTSNTKNDNNNDNNNNNNGNKNSSDSVDDATNALSNVELEKKEDTKEENEKNEARESTDNNENNNTNNSSDDDMIRRQSQTVMDAALRPTMSTGETHHYKLLFVQAMQLLQREKERQNK